MLRKLTVTCPKEVGKDYFSFKKQRYENDLNVYVNNAMLFSHLNDAEEFLPLVNEREIELDETKVNTIKFEYNMSFGPDKEKVDVEFTLDKNNRCTTKIHRYNYVPGSINLDEQYLVTFDISGQKTFLDKSYHEGDNADITFESYYTYPLDIKWYSKKPFTDTGSVYWDHIELRIQ